MVLIPIFSPFLPILSISSTVLTFKRLTMSSSKKLSSAHSHKDWAQPPHRKARKRRLMKTLSAFSTVLRFLATLPLSWVLPFQDTAVLTVVSRPITSLAWPMPRLADALKRARTALRLKRVRPWRWHRHSCQSTRRPRMRTNGTEWWIDWMINSEVTAAVFASLSHLTEGNTRTFGKRKGNEG